MRLFNLLVIIGLVLAAAYVYEIKLQSTIDAERLAQMRGEIRRERDTIAGLRAEWARLTKPRRVEGLAQRHLSLKPIEPRQMSSLDDLPAHPVIQQDDATDPIARMIEDTDIPTGSIAKGSAAP